MYTQREQAKATTQRAAGASVTTPGAEQAGWRGLEGSTFEQQEARLTPPSPVQRRAEATAGPAAPGEEANRIGFYPTLGDLYDAAMRFQDVKGHSFEGAGHDELVAWLKQNPRRPAALSRVKTADVIARGLVAVGDDLASCADAVKTMVTVVPTALDEALKWGQTFRALAPIIGARDESVLDTEVFLEVVRSDAAGPLVDYFNACAPGLDGGPSDVASMLAMLREGVDYKGVRAALPTLHNVHRFEGRALAGLRKSWADTSKSKPLTVILHSSVDHNGSFHRDPYITEVVTHPRYTTVLIEGKNSLADAADELRAVAASHGKDGKVANVIIAGHGSPQEVELTETESLRNGPEEVPEDASKIEKKEIEEKNEGNQALLDALEETAAPDSRIVLNACLTNATNPTSLVDAADDPAKLIEARKNLAGVLAKDVLGDESGKRVHSAQAVTNATDIIRLGGRMQLDVKGDKAASKADRLAYVAKGTERKGCLYALIDVAASDAPAALTAAKARLAKPVSGPVEPLIGALLRIALPYLADEKANLAALNALDEPSDAVLPSSPDECRPAAIQRALKGVTPEVARALLEAATAVPSQHPLSLVALRAVQYLEGFGPPSALLDAMGQPGLTCRLMEKVLDASKLVEKGVHKEQVGSVGWRRFVLLAAKLKNPKVGGLIEQHLMLDTHLRTESLIDIEGFATPHEILVGAGLRPPGKK